MMTKEEFRKDWSIRHGLPFSTMRKSLCYYIPYTEPEFEEAYREYVRLQRSYDEYLKKRQERHRRKCGW